MEDEILYDGLTADDWVELAKVLSEVEDEECEREEEAKSTENVEEKKEVEEKPVEETEEKKEE